MNCQICGRHLSRAEIGKWKKDRHPICSKCRKEQLKEIIAEASPSQIEVLKANKDDAPLIDAILKEQQGFTGERPPETRKYERAPKIEKCGPGEVYDIATGKCVKISEKTASELQGVREHRRR